MADGYIIPIRMSVCMPLIYFFGLLFTLIIMALYSRSDQTGLLVFVSFHVVEFLGNTNACYDSQYLSNDSQHLSML